MHYANLLKAHIYSKSPLCYPRPGGSLTTKGEINLKSVAGDKRYLISHISFPFFRHDNNEIEYSGKVEAGTMPKKGRQDIYPPLKEDIKKSFSLHDDEICFFSSNKFVLPLSSMASVIKENVPKILDHANRSGDR